MRALLLSSCLIALVLTCLFLFGLFIEGPEDYGRMSVLIGRVFGR